MTSLPEEPALVRHTVTIAATEYEQTLGDLLDSFPFGFEEEREGTVIRISAYLPVGDELQLPAGYSAAVEAVASGWRESWRAFHQPVQIGGFWIGPPWREADAPVACERISIEPAMAFGTGAHGSTRATIELLLSLGSGTRPLVDIGCGSGVLSIVAARLGYGPIMSLDRDSDAVEATLENARRNGVELTVRCLDALYEPLPRAPLALANLQLEILEPLFERDGLPDSVIVSGLLLEEEFAPRGWRSLATRERDGWRAELLRRGSDARARTLRA